MACPEPEGMMDQENKYLTALEQAANNRKDFIALVMFDAEEGVRASHSGAEIAVSR
jgi:hypothetical protein